MNRKDLLKYISDYINCWEDCWETLVESVSNFCAETFRLG